MAFSRFLKLLKELEADAVLSWTQRVQTEDRAWEGDRDLEVVVVGGFHHDDIIY